LQEDVAPGQRPVKTLSTPSSIIASALAKLGQPIQEVDSALLRSLSRQVVSSQATYLLDKPLYIAWSLPDEFNEVVDTGV